MTPEGAMGELEGRMRELIGDFIGKTVIDITTSDVGDPLPDGYDFVMLMFEDGSCLKFPIGNNGFERFPPRTELVQGE